MPGRQTPTQIDSPHIDAGPERGQRGARRRCTAPNRADPIPETVMAGGRASRIDARADPQGSGRPTDATGCGVPVLTYPHPAGPVAWPHGWSSRRDPMGRRGVLPRAHSSRRSPKTESASRRRRWLSARHGGSQRAGIPVAHGPEANRNAQEGHCLSARHGARLEAGRTTGGNESPRLQASPPDGGPPCQHRPAAQLGRPCHAPLR